MTITYFDDESSAISVDGTTVALSGELDIRTLASLRRALLDAAETAGGALRPVHVDLTGVTFIDSASIGLLITAKRRVEQSNTPFAIVGCSEHVRRVLEIMGLVTVFGIAAERP